MRPRSIFCLRIALACLLAAVAGCEGGTDRFAEILPELDADDTRLLAACLEPGFELAPEISSDRLIELRRHVLEARFLGSSLDDEGAALLGNAVARLEESLAVRGLPEYAADTRFLTARPADETTRLLQLRKDVDDVFARPEGNAADLATQIDSLRIEMEAVGDDRGVIVAWNHLSVLENRQNNWDRARTLQHRALEESRRVGDLRETAHAWGQCLMFKMRWGWTDADRDTLQDLVARTDRAGLVIWSSYLVTFQAYDAYNMGRYATARSLFEDAVEICYRGRESSSALTAMSMLLRLDAALNCWTRVDENLVRANLIMAAWDEERRSSPKGRLTRVRHDLLAAQSLAAKGRVDEAHAAFENVVASAVDLPYDEGDYAGLLWLETLMEHDRADLMAEALPRVSVRYEKGPDAPTYHWVRRWEGWLSWRQGDTAAARASLDIFARQGLAADPFIFHEAALSHRAMVARVRWDEEPVAGAALLAEGWRKLAARIAAHEPGPEAYLDLGRNHQLRDAAHDLLGTDPSTGYGLELLWRETCVPAGVAPDTTAGLAAAARGLTERARARLADLDAMHCLFRLDGDRVQRWTATAAGVEADVLDLSAPALRELVSTALDDLAQMPRDVEAGLPDRLATELSTLAGALLPDRIRYRDRRPRLLLVSGEGFLAQIPFAPLDLDPGDAYVPLAAEVDVAWCRRGPGPVESATGPPLIVAATELSAATRRRFALGETLPGAVAELTAVARVAPRGTVLAGGEATRERVLAALPAAAAFHFVGHAVADPHTPFASWLPLAAGNAAEPYPGLDMKDIVSSPLAGCGLVVLSGCATGAPYVDGQATAPSLGDAFLDAGAAAAVQTFWPVRDEGSRFRPERILAAWRADGNAVAALNAERRHAMMGKAGVRHPSDWAAWSVKLGRW